MHSDTSLSPITIDLGATRSYPYHIESLQRVPELMAASGLRIGKCMVITDATVARHYANTLEEALLTAGWQPERIVVTTGEKAKGYADLHQIYDAALSSGIDRKTPVLALGGGVVGDLAGFAAASLLRGLPFVQLPTTLIAQVDSALGGKTGINHATGKNLIGAFHQPAFVCADLKTLQSLPFREWTSGLAEVVKHALIADIDFVSWLEDNWAAVIDRDASILGTLIHRAAGIKAVVVSQDEREAGLRAILNFGHTFGHAIEHVAGYGHFTHGEAVAMGMRAALHLSARLHPALDVQRAADLVKKLPIQASAIDMPVDDLVAAMYTDKKVLAGRIRFVLLDKVGHAYVEADADMRDATWAFEEMLKNLHL
ncbi:MAG: 3-dehydroquinate synthase [Bacteroidota bacterium]